MMTLFKVRPGHPGKVLACGCAFHFFCDGIADGLFVLLPLWQIAFDLSLTQVGLFITCFEGAMALAQVPAGFLSERLGERFLLITGTIVSAVSFMALGLAGGFFSLLVLLLISGLASGVHHPLSSSIVSRAYQNGGRRAALGTFNFSGDVGKFTFPALAALALTVMDWRKVGVIFGLIGILVMFVSGSALQKLHAGGAPDKIKTRRKNISVKGWGIEDRLGFSLLSIMGFLDTAVRTGLFTLLPFFLISHGLPAESTGFALSLAFIGGAAGKFFCGLLAERLGIIPTVLLTEGVTAAGIFLLLCLPLKGIFILLPVLGAALNGTSSVFYGTVADFVSPQRLGRVFGLFYTFVIAGSALAPVVFGNVSDRFDLRFTIMVIAVTALFTLPLALCLRRSVKRTAGHST
jgi:MFS family permease